jgi:hypothetical protein
VMLWEQKHTALRRPPSFARPRSSPKLNESGRTGLSPALRNNAAAPEYGGVAV